MNCVFQVSSGSRTLWLPNCCLHSLILPGENVGNTVDSCFLPAEGVAILIPCGLFLEGGLPVPSSFRGERESRVWLGIPLSRNEASR